MRPKDRQYPPTLNQQKPYFSTQTYLRNPVTVNPVRNQKRAQQISCLHQQFQDLKHKIKEVQSKNQKIIDKIHKAFSFKKKGVGVYTQQHIPAAEPDDSHIIYYDKNYHERHYLQGSNVGSISHNPSSIDGKSQKSDQSEYQFRMGKRPSHVSNNQQSKKKKVIQQKFQKSAMSNFNVSMEYGRNYGKQTDPLIIRKKRQIDIQRDASERGSVRTPGTQIPLQRTNIMQYQNQQHPSRFYGGNSPSARTQSTYQKKISYLQETLSIQKQKVSSLASQLSLKEAEVYSLQSVKQKFQGYAKSAKIIMQTHLEDFIENIIRNGMLDIDRSIKKNQSKMNKLINLLVDAQQQKQSKSDMKLIKGGLKNRNDKVSRDRIIDRDHQRSRNSKEMSRSRSKYNGPESQNRKTNKQFQDIAAKYQLMIQQKNQEIQAIDKKLKLKQKQCAEFKMKLQTLQLKLQEEQKKISRYENIVKTTPSFTNLNGYRTLENLDLRSSNNVDFGQQQILLNSEKSNTQNISNSMLSVHDLEKLEFQQKIQKLDKQLILKDQKIGNLQRQIESLSNKNQMMYEQYQENLSQNRTNKSKNQQQLESKIKSLQKQIVQKASHNSSMQASLNEFQKRLMQKECQLYGLNEKILKYEKEVKMNENKIRQLQNLLVANNQQGQSNLDKSLLIQDALDINTIKKLKEEISKLQEQIEVNKNQNYGLLKKNQFQQNKIRQAENKANELRKRNQILEAQIRQMDEIVNKKQANYDLKNQGSIGFDNSSDNQERIRLQEEIFEVSKKYTQAKKALQESRNQNVSMNSQLIKMKSQLEFQMTIIQQKQRAISKQKIQKQILSQRMRQLQRDLLQKSEEVEIERKENQQKIKEIQQQWKDFQQQMKLQVNFNQQNFDMRSERSSVVNFKNNFNKLSTQNEYLAQKLKEAEAQIQMQNTIDQKIIQEYKSNADKANQEIRKKKQENEKLLVELQKLKKRVSLMDRQKQRSDSKSSRSQKNSGINLKDFPGIPLSIQQEEIASEEENKIQELQNQLKQTKDINNKLTEMSNQLFEQIKAKEQEKHDLIRNLQQRNYRIQQLEDLLQLKDLNFGSNISATNKSRYRDSLKSQSSLRYSAASNVRNTNNNDKTIEIDLSEAGSSFFQNSQIVQNVSQLFDKEEFPYEKMKLKRKEQVKLFEKTASYIKTLKQAIQDKNKRIRILQKKIESLKTNELVRKDLAGYDIMQDERQKFEKQYDDKDFRDYESVQLEYKRSTHHRRYKILEHDTKLVIEENNMLVHQIQSLQEELLKSEQQQNSLVKIKDLYKEEIKKLIKKNQEQTKSFEEEINRQRRKNQESQNVHNFQAIKQLFVKMASVFGSIQQQSKGRKRQQKKKQLQEYIKVMCSILKVQITTKDRLLAGIRT